MDGTSGFEKEAKAEVPITAFYTWRGAQNSSISLQVNNKYVHFVQSGLSEKLWHTAVALQALITSASKHTAKYGIFRFQTDRKLEMTLSVKPVYQLHNEPFLKEKKNSRNVFITGPLSSG